MSSAVCASLSQRSQVSPSCPSIIMPTFMVEPPWLDTLPYPRPNERDVSDRRAALAPARAHHDLSHRGFRGGGTPSRRGSRGSGGEAEHDGRRAARLSAHAALRPPLPRPHPPSPASPPPPPPPPPPPL